MRLFQRTLSSAILCIIIGPFCFAVDYPKSPLNARVVAALVAGGALPESVAIDIRDQGIDFHPSAKYLGDLQKSGASAMVIQAIRQAKIASSEIGQSADDDVVLQHILAAGEKVQAKKLFEAAKEISSANANIEDHPELAFVIGEIAQLQVGAAQSVAVYSKLIELAPEFPEVHTKFALALYRADDYERGLQEAVAALARTPENPEAHKNKAMNLEAMSKYDAAIDEYQQALKLKPDYEKVLYDLGLLYYRRRDYRNSITEYRKALSMDPSDANAHFNLALALQMAREHGSAIAECREVIRLDPQRTDARTELAELLVETGNNQAAFNEFRQVIKTSPDSPDLHSSFARLLYRAREFGEAITEYKRAIELDPQDADSHFGLGLVLEDTKEGDKALKEFMRAAGLGRDDGTLHRELGKMYFDQKQTSNAILELKRAISFIPADGPAHFFLARAFESDNNTDQAITEYQQAVSLIDVSSDMGCEAAKNLATLLEKSGKPKEALQLFRRRYDGSPSPETKADYNAAQQRLAASIAAENPVATLSASNTSKSGVSEAAVRADEEARDLLPRYQERMQAMQQAMADQHWNEAEELGNSAIALAQKMVPHDVRLVNAIITMGNMFQGERKFDEAEKEFLLAIKVSDELWGPRNTTSAMLLTSIGGNYFQQQKYPQAVEYLNRALALREVLSGKDSDPQALEFLGLVYEQQGDLNNAEQVYRRMLAAEEAQNGPDSSMSTIALERLGQLYCAKHDYAQAQSIFERRLAIEEKQYGPNSPSLQGSLNELATALRGLGKIEEARALEHRRELLAANAH